MRQLVVIFFIVSAITNTQEIKAQEYSNGDLIIGPYASTVTMDNFSTKFGMGVSAEYFFGKTFAFAGVIGGGSNYAEFSGSVLGLFGWLGSKSSTSDGYYILLMPFIIENPSLHFRLGRTNDLSISVNFMKFRYIYEKNSYYEEDWFATYAATLRYSFVGKSNWQWSLFAEGTAMYYVHNPRGLQFGIAIRHLGLAPN